MGFREANISEGMRLRGEWESSKMERQQVRLCNVAFESGGVLGDWRSVVIAPLYKGKGEKTECKNYRGISLLSVVGKIYAEI